MKCYAYILKGLTLIFRSRLVTFYTDILIVCDCIISSYIIRDAIFVNLYTAVILKHNEFLERHWNLSFILQNFCILIDLLRTFIGLLSLS